MARILTVTALAFLVAAPVAQAQVPAAKRQVNAPAGGEVQAAQPAARAQPNARTEGAVNDWLFAEAAALGGMAELQLSEVGIQRSNCDELKTFSKEMIEAHSKMNQELTTLAAQKRVALPRVLDARAQFCAQSLSGLTGDHFDHCYAKAQLHAHEAALVAFEAEAERGQDADMKAFAKRNISHIKEHLHKIKPILEKMEKDRKDDDHPKSESSRSK